MKNIFLFSPVYKFCAILLMCFFVHSHFTFAQTTYIIDFDYDEGRPTNITPANHQYLDNLQNDDATISLKYFDIQTIKSNIVTEKENLTIQVKVNNATITLNVIESREDHLGGTYWYGGNTTNDAYLALYTHTSYPLLSGFFQSNEGFYEVQPINSDKSVVRKINASHFYEIVCSKSDGTAASNQTLAIDLCNEDFDCETVVDALVLIPPDVMTWYQNEFAGNIWGVVFHIWGSLFSFQAAAINSGIDGVEIRYHFANFNFTYSSPLLFETDISNLTNVAAPIRNDYNADIVMLWTSQNYPGIAGVANALGPCEDCAFLISEVQNNINPRWTLAHEIAHLFGARHNRSANVPCGSCGDDAPSCNHGFRFDLGGLDRTILANLTAASSAPTGSERTLHFSNPNIQFNGFDTGTLNDFNAAAIANSACIISDFRPNPFLEVSISVNTPICEEDGDFTAFANVNEAATAYPGHPPYTFSWLATNSAPVSSSSSSAYVDFNCSGCTVTVSCTVTSSDGISVTGTRNVEIIPEPCTYSPPPTNKIPIPITSNHFGSFVFPNPVKDFLYVTPTIDYLDEFQYALFDITGKRVLKGKTSNKSKLQLNVEGLESGIYFLKMNDQNISETIKILKK